MTTDNTIFKQKLDAEKARLEKELSTVAHKDNGANWEAKGTLVDESTDADPNEVADKLEEFETNQAIVISLNTELRDITDALERMENGTYGICEVSGEKIEEDRLEANPSARTCKAHMNR